MNRVLKILGLSIAYVTVRTLEMIIQDTFEKLITEKRTKQEYQKQNGRTL